MFETLKNVFRVKEMRRKLLYVVWMIFVIRIGSQLPVPGVDTDVFRQWFQSNTGDAFNFFDAFTGGSFESMSVFALNITPYITSSIIIQLLTIAIPALEEMHCILCLSACSSRKLGSSSVMLSGASAAASSAVAAAISFFRSS